ncbi:MAG: CARDB domain-containing protein, partial [Candidatus Bathyarchaeia archaeon]
MVQSLRSSLIVLLILVLSSSTSVSTATVEEFSVESTSLTVYRDGLVHVAQTIVVNETVPYFTLTLFSNLVENLLVTDENQTILDYEMVGQNITIFSLGCQNVFLEYDTVALTGKEAEVWTIAFWTPYNLTLALPLNSVLMDFNDIPESIKIYDGKIQLALLSGFWEISYVVLIAKPPKFVVSNLASNPDKVYVGEKVTVSVLVTNVGDETGSYTVSLKIGQSVEDSKTVTLKGGQSTTVTFDVTKSFPGIYTVIVGDLTSEFTVLASPTFPFLELTAALVVSAGIVLLFLLRRPRRPNVKKIFRSNPYLRDEDKKVIMFIAEKGGKAFEAEIRSHFSDMPRTSLWRLIKRLEKLDIVKVKRVGLENQVEL